MQVRQDVANHFPAITMTEKIEVLDIGRDVGIEGATPFLPGEIETHGGDRIAALVGRRQPHVIGLSEAGEHIIGQLGPALRRHRQHEHCCR